MKQCQVHTLILMVKCFNHCPCRIDRSSSNELVPKVNKIPSTPPPVTSTEPPAMFSLPRSSRSHLWVWDIDTRTPCAREKLAWRNKFGVEDASVLNVIVALRNVTDWSASVSRNRQDPLSKTGQEYFDWVHGRLGKIKWAKIDQTESTEDLLFSQDWLEQELLELTYVGYTHTDPEPDQMNIEEFKWSFFRTYPSRKETGYLCRRYRYSRLGSMSVINQLRNVDKWKKQVAESTDPTPIGYGYYQFLWQEAVRKTGAFSNEWLTAELDRMERKGYSPELLGFPLFTNDERQRQFEFIEEAGEKKSSLAPMFYNDSNTPDAEPIFPKWGVFAPSHSMIDALAAEFVIENKRKISEHVDFYKLLQVVKDRVFSPCHFEKEYLTPIGIWYFRFLDECAFVNARNFTECATNKEDVYLVNPMWARTELDRLRLQGYSNSSCLWDREKAPIANCLCGLIDIDGPVSHQVATQVLPTSPDAEEKEALAVLILSSAANNNNDGAPPPPRSSSPPPSSTQPPTPPSPPPPVSPPPALFPTLLTEPVFPPSISSLQLDDNTTSRPESTLPLKKRKRHLFVDLTTGAETTGVKTPKISPEVKEPKT